MLDRTSASAPQENASHDVAAVEQLRLQIEAHQKEDAARSVLKNAVGSVGSVFVKENVSLEELRDFYREQQNNLKEGKKVDSERIQSLIESDRQSSDRTNEIVDYGSHFLKTGVLFMRGRLGLAGTIAVFTLDQIRPADSPKEMFVDALMGAAKGGLMKGAMHWVGSKPVGIAAKGIALGAGSRVLELGLTRQTYLDPRTGELNFKKGLGDVLTGSLNKTALAADVVIFGVAHGLLGGVNRVSGGVIEKSPLLNSMLTGTTFGLSSGATGELMRQNSAGEKFDLGKVMKRSLIQGGLDTLAAAPGGIQADPHVQGRIGNYMRARVDSIETRLEGLKTSFTNLASMSLDGGLALAPAGIPDGMNMSQLRPNEARSRAKPEGQRHLEPAAKVFDGHAAEPKMLGEDSMRRYSREIERTDLEAWRRHNLSSEAEVLYAQLDNLMDHGLKNNLSEELGRHAIHDKRLALAALKDTPELFQRYEAYLIKRRPFEQEIAKLFQTIHARVAQVQKVADKIADHNDFARISVTVDELKHPEGVIHGAYGGGRLFVNIDDIYGATQTATQRGTLVHELVHAEQDNLIIRRMADELNIGKSARREQLDALRDLYARRIGEPKHTDDYLKQVLAKREGRVLDSKLAQRADKLIASAHLLGNSAFEEVIPLRELFAREDGVRRAFHALRGEDGRKERIALFGRGELPADVAKLAKKLERSSGDFDEAEAGKVFSRYLSQAEKDRFSMRLINGPIADSKTKFDDIYRDLFHEQEAFSVEEAYQNWSDRQQKALQQAEKECSEATSRQVLVELEGGAWSLIGGLNSGRLKPLDVFGREKLPVQIEELLKRYRRIEKGLFPKSAWRDAEASRILERPLQKHSDEVYQRLVDVAAQIGARDYLKH